MSGSTLHLSTLLEPLAEKLDALLRQEAAALKDPFVPATIIVPSADVRTWLQLYLARKQNVAINLRLQYLENALWEILGEMTTMRDPVARLEHENYRLLILSILLEETVTDPALQPVAAYLGKKDLKQREYCRRVWDLADQLARLIRDYEYHRQDDFIQKWIKQQSALSGVAGITPDALALERCQRALFAKIIDEKTGLRARLSKHHGITFKTLPQYAQEVMERPLREREEWPQSLQTRPVHLFGVAQISPYHIRVLRWLSSHLTVRIYHVNPLVSRLDPKLCAKDGFKALNETAKRFDHPHRAKKAPGDELLGSWGQAAAASFHRMSELLASGDSKPLTCELLLPAERKPRGVLQRVQNDLLAHPEKKHLRLGQDVSVQIAACPGIVREVETVWNSIVANLLRDKELRLSDIAVLVPRMALYRPVIQTIFDRDVQHMATGARIRPPIAYNLGDCRASELSVFGQALMAMFDAALDGFPRTRVLDVLSNPCFLARLHAAPEQTAVWLNWAEQLGIYHGWDQRDKKESGYTDSPLYSWRRALQRLRLGRIMETPSGSPDEPLPSYREIVPYADLESGDAEQLNAFCRAVEELLPRLTEFRRKPATGAEWAQRLRELLVDFLDIPEDREDEAAVRAALLRSLELLETLDGVSTKSEQLSLPLVREFIAAQLEDLGVGNATGRYGCVTITALQSARPLPFKIVYVLGLGEGLFPGPEISSPFDLRERKRLPVDIRSSDAQRLQFLDVLAATRQKLYLLYSSKELQKDQTLYPCSLINQLRTYIDDRVLPAFNPEKMPLFGEEFKANDGFIDAQIPLNGHDPKFLQEAGEEQQYCDLATNVRRADRVLALQEALAAGQLDLGLSAEATQSRVAALANASRGELLQSSGTNSADPQTIARVTLRDLRYYLENPARAALRRHLRVQTEFDLEASDDEPFYTDDRETDAVVQTALQRFVAKASVPDAPEPDYNSEFAEAYEDRRRMGLAPDGDFAAADRARLRAVLRQRIEGVTGSLSEFVDTRGKPAFLGRIQIGQSRVPAGAQLHFPALRIPLERGGAPLDVQVSGSWDLVWRASDRLDLAVVLHGSDDIDGRELSKHLFEPVLFYLALLAGEDKNAGGQSSSEWVGARPLRLSVAFDTNIAEFTYAGIEPDAARAYLKSLAADFLATGTFDNLPFKTASHRTLNAAYMGEDGPELSTLRQYYVERFQTALDQEFDTENTGEPRIDPLELIELHVPDDAFEKIRRRFRLLDLGPRVNRNAAAEEKSKPRATGTITGSAKKK